MWRRLFHKLSFYYHLNERYDQMHTTQAELQKRLDDAEANVQKIFEESSAAQTDATQLRKDFDALVAQINSGETPVPDATEASMSKLEGSLKKLDDLRPDKPA